jgi:hypothetical protein
MVQTTSVPSHRCIQLGEVRCELSIVRRFVDGDDTVKLLAAICNSTLTALFKTFYGRYTGTEGNLETMVSKFQTRALQPLKWLRI